MTPEQQRIKIAEACGLNVTSNTICPYCKGITPYEAGDDYGITIWAECKTCNNTGKVKPYYTSLPDYLNDLNAMHEAVSIFDYDQADEFEDHLCDICKRSNDKKDNPVPWRFAVINATAAQRARAFLETLGLWENGSA